MMTHKVLERLIHYTNAAQFSGPMEQMNGAELVHMPDQGSMVPAPARIRPWGPIVPPPTGYD